MPVASSSRFVDTIWHDLRYALRTLTKSWGFTTLAVASLGIGLGANTALFSLVDALLLRSLPVADPARLVLVQRTAANGKAVPIDAGSLDVIRGLTSIYQRCRAVDGASGRDGHDRQSARTGPPGVQGDRRLLLHARRRRSGRTTARRRACRGHQRSVLDARFQRDRSVVGRRIAVNDDAYAIAGIAAPGFLGVSLDSAGDIWLVQPQFRGAAVSAIARLAPGVSIAQAAAATAGPLSDADLPAGAIKARSRRRCSREDKARRIFASDTACPCSR